MKLRKYCIGLIFLSAVIIAAVTPAAAWESTEWIEGGDGFMVNNIIIDVGSVGVTKDEDNSSNTTGNASISVYEWKNDNWSRVNGTKLSLDQTMRFAAADGNYTVHAVDFREVGRFNEVKLEIWSNANVTNSGVIEGGHSNASGAGRPNLVITQVVTPSENVSVDDLITVSVYVNNSGGYDAKNVTIHKPNAPLGFMMSGVITDNTVNQTINKNTNNTYYVYQLKAVEPGNYELGKATADAENELGGKYNYTQNNTARITVADLAALTFAAAGPNGNTVDYHTRSKIDGNITIRNTGTMPAQYVSIDFSLPDGAAISGDNITVNGNTATYYMDSLTPNNQRVIEYSLSAKSGGVYDVSIAYSYNYNGSAKTGAIQSVSYSAVGNNMVGTLLEYWYFLFIPVILIAGAALFIWRRHREYKF
ncbi:MAG: hypothetical protein LBU81_08210 [Methanosarcinales archaeon]|nr:hypothetical protein [Methanosarcinales archaeon]